MSQSIKLEVVTPERPVFSAEVAEVQFPTASRGYYGILPGHTPVMTEVGDGLLYYIQDGQKHWLTVFGGFAEIGPDHVTILARESETMETLDLERAEASRQRALKLLKDAQTEHDMAAAQAKLNASLIRLQAAGHPSGHGF
ncbi:MAG: ATP synthase F1 subunit epsilon [Geothrix sp.]|jgi:F-type H+-transporting ATPase subunit epsilon|uniref:ATP synthase epsilon chain n=1 Tax=Candidatus Geothrix odensensis TaxID=2954440 RepID=A0A936K8L6_9BACT|nr:ATP synthase F1 subunit epsilon [Holophagaceae bacterium]MBK8573622.1 ATP synthase F1 subunit epsilon [Candidatus Geothrix odensensis]MBK8790618.1 ATP synthase F1 subunit epsilon [Holophagaceae bacterium]MCC6514456.1 ATP synthase F1 subunit epsilon [Geothrix sp.]